MVFSPKYRIKILTDDVALVTESLIRKTCSEIEDEEFMLELKNRCIVYQKVINSDLINSNYSFF